MVDQKQHKTPEELGEAVGKKIEELFGGMFEDDMPPEPSSPPAGGPRHGAEPTPSTAPPPIAPPRTAQPQVPQTSRPPASPPTRRAAVPPQTKKPGEPQAAGRPATTGRPAATDSFDSIIEQIEILILNLEWEVSPESVSELAEKFRSLESYFPGEGQARTVLAMNRRGLLRFTSRDSVPHPALIKLLQDSVGVLKLIRSSQGKRPAGEALISGLTQSYKEIMGASVPAAAPSAAEARADAVEQRRQYGALINSMGGAVHSLEEVSRRLSRILGVLRQGGDMSPEEVTRRLGTLEHLLADHVGQLSSCHKELIHAVPTGADSKVPAERRTPDGLVIVVWSGIHVAIPSSVVAALYPLSKAQAEQFLGKQTIALGPRQLQTLPLKKPQTAGKATVLPTWLVHLAGGRGDYFLLVDRSLGFRRTPEGIDIFRQAKIKLGPTAYVVLNHSALR